MNIIDQMKIVEEYNDFQIELIEIKSAKYKGDLRCKNRIIQSHTIAGLNVIFVTEPKN
jgi:hypothetical protein